MWLLLQRHTAPLAAMGISHTHTHLKMIKNNKNLTAKFKMIKRLRDSSKKDNRWQINRKRCSVSWAIRETNIRATKTYHIPVTVAKAKHISVGHCGGSAGKGFCCRAWRSEFDPWEAQARRQLTPPKLSPYYHTRAMTHVPPHTQRKQSNKCDLKIIKPPA